MLPRCLLAVTVRTEKQQKNRICATFTCSWNVALVEQVPNQDIKTWRIAKLSESFCSLRHSGIFSEGVIVQMLCGYAVGSKQTAETDVSYYLSALLEFIHKLNHNSPSCHSSLLLIAQTGSRHTVSDVQTNTQSFGFWKSCICAHSAVWVNL